jgi:hypothetical protein
MRKAAHQRGDRRPEPAEDRFRDHGTGQFAVANHGLRSTARPLEASVRATLEPAYGHDLSHVRIHDDSEAGAAAAALGATAYTVGSDLVFGNGVYAPESPSGMMVLAHELAHVVQRDAFGARAGDIAVSQRDDATERDAATMTSVVLGGDPAPTPAAPAAAVSRLEKDEGFRPSFPPFLTGPLMWGWDYLLYSAGKSEPRQPTVSEMVQQLIGKSQFERGLVEKQQEQAIDNSQRALTGLPPDWFTRGQGLPDPLELHQYHDVSPALNWRELQDREEEKELLDQMGYK